MIAENQHTNFLGDGLWENSLCAWGGEGKREKIRKCKSAPAGLSVGPSDLPQAEICLPFKSSVAALQQMAL